MREEHSLSHSRHGLVLAKTFVKTCILPVRTDPPHQPFSQRSFLGVRYLLLVSW